MTLFADAPLFRLEVDVHPPVPLDPQGDGPVRLVSITGGRVLGGLSGRIVPGGTDWQTLGPDGTLGIEARYLIELDDGARIELQSRGQRAAGAAGFWSAIWLRTVAPGHAELNTVLYLGLGRKREGGVDIAVYALPDPG